MKLLKNKRLIKYLIYIVVVVSMVVTSGTLARYTSEEAAVGTASIALFAAGTSYEANLYLGENIYPGATQNLVFTVENYGENNVVSEVALTYDIIIVTTNNLPLSFNLSGTGASGGAGDRLVGAFNQTTLQAAGGILPAGTTKTQHRYTLTVDWPERIRDDGYSDEIDMVTIKVNTMQADPT